MRTSRRARPRAAWRTVVSFCAAVGLSQAPPLGAQELTVNGGFELGALGWTEWAAPWGAPPTYDYAFADDVFDGESSLLQTATSGSFGVYQELCVEPGAELLLSWAWRGASSGNGWWEVLVVDGPYSYEAVDDPGNHPETHFASKWETGFGGPFPAPSDEWVEESFELVPISRVITIVLKCGSTAGGRVEASFDAVRLEQDTEELAITAVVPSSGPLEGGTTIRVEGWVFPEGSTLRLGDVEVPGAVRASSCEFVGATPPGEPGLVDVIVTTPSGGVVGLRGFTYVGPPSISSVEPASGSVDGGTEITIRGAGFVPPVQVRVGNRLAVQLSAEDDAIVALTPAGDPGPAAVRVRTDFGEAVLSDGFTYEAPAGPFFVRGDCNGDGAVTGQVTDAVFLLNFNFSGGAPPPCAAACDANGDGRFAGAVTDAIYLLNFNFLGGVAPPAPFPECGALSRPEDEALGCEASSAGCEG